MHVAAVGCLTIDKQKLTPCPLPPVHPTNSCPGNPLTLYMYICVCVCVCAYVCVPAHARSRLPVVGPASDRCIRSRASLTSSTALLRRPYLLVRVRPRTSTPPDELLCGDVLSLLASPPWALWALFYQLYTWTRPGDSRMEPPP